MGRRGGTCSWCVVMLLLRFGQLWSLTRVFLSPESQSICLMKLRWRLRSSQAARPLGVGLGFSLDPHTQPFWFSSTPP